MIDHGQMHQKMRDYLLTLSVCTTGSITMSVTTDGYARATGSFVTDGLAAGMELVASGFSKAANNGTKTIIEVSAQLVRVAGAVAEASGSGRTLAVGLPAGRALENMVFDPPDGIPWVEEQYIPGPQYLYGISALSRHFVEPMYNVKVHVPSDVGTRAAHAYATALLNLFPPSLVLTALPNGDVLKVRGDVGPSRGQLLHSLPGFVVVPITIPFRLSSVNSI